MSHYMRRVFGSRRTSDDAAANVANQTHTTRQSTLTSSTDAEELSALPLGIEVEKETPIAGDGSERESQRNITALQAASTDHRAPRDVAAAASEERLSETVDVHDKEATTIAKDETSSGNSAYDGEAGAETEQDDESKYITGYSLVMLTVGLFFSTFVVALDNTIIATAIPRITSIFDSLNDVGWYGSAYLLTTTSLQPSFGKIYTYFDVKWVYISALLIFELGSILCAAATSSVMLIVGRAVAGAGAAALFSGAMTIVGYSVPLRKRALFIAALSSTFGIASIVGPILGGAFTDHVSWRWCFWINLPFGAISIAVVWIFFKNPPRRHTDMTVREKIKQIDIAGACFLICAIVCLLLALQWGGTVYPWSDSKVWGCLLGFGLLLLVFIGLQVRLGDRATMPPRIVCKQRTVAACALFSMFLAMALYTHIYFLPFYFQAVKGTSAEGSGIRTIPYLVSNTLASIVVGASITIIGPYNPPMWIGSIVFVIGSGLLYTLKVTSSTGIWIGYQILAGVGAGACVQIPFIAIQVVLPQKDMPVGNAVAIFFNTLGGALSISIAQNIFSNTLKQQLPRLAPGIDPRLIIAAGATHVREVTARMPELYPAVVEAYNRAVTTAFILPIAVGALAFLSSLMMEWKSVKGKSLIPGAA